VGVEPLPALVLPAFGVLAAGEDAAPTRVPAAVLTGRPGAALELALHLTWNLAALVLAAAMVMVAALLAGLDTRAALHLAAALERAAIVMLTTLLTALGAGAALDLATALTLAVIVAALIAALALTLGASLALRATLTALATALVVAV